MRNSNIYDRISFWSLFLVLSLLPLFSLPFTNIPVEASKGLLVVIGLFVSILFWAIARYFEGRITIPASSILWGGLGIVFAFLLSALMSEGKSMSFFGIMFDIGSFWFIFSGFILLFMSSVVFRNPVHSKMVLLGMTLSSLLVLVFQILHVLFPSALSLGIMPGKTGNLIGSWNALGIFAGFSGLMYLFQTEFFSLGRVGKTLLQLLILLALFMTAAINFPIVWVLLGISALIIFVYKASGSYFKNGVGEKRFPILSFVVVIICLLFFISGQFIGSYIPNSLGISNIEAGPSFGATMWTAKGILVNDPAFGIGPNKFGEAWAMYKPESINKDQFWDIPFDSGSGLLSTIIIPTGILGITAWIIFLGLLIWKGVKAVLWSVKNGSNWEMVAFFVLSLYLYISLFLYSGGATIFLLSFAFTGIFAGLSAESAKKEKSFSFSEDYRKSIFAILALVVLVIFSSAMTFKFVERFASIPYFRQALTATTVPEAENSIRKAISLYPNDLYLRTYSQVQIVELNSLVAKGESLTDEEKRALQESFDQAVAGAEFARAANPSSYLNHALLGFIYQSAGSLGVKEGFGKAIEAFNSASSLNPLNPGLKLSLANTYLLENKLAEAKENANKALTLKPDYVDALLVLSGIARREGNNAEAVSYAERALALFPGNKELTDYINTLKGSAAAGTPSPNAEE